MEALDPNDPGGEVDASQYTVVRRPPQRSHATKYDIYVAANRNLQILHKRITTMLIEERAPCVNIYGLGPRCILSAVKLAVEACERHAPQLVSTTTTDTAMMIDDYKPLISGLRPFSRQRRVSSIRIVLSLNRPPLT